LTLAAASAGFSPARRSVGIGFLTDALRVQMSCLLAQLDLLEQQRSFATAKSKP
jgi:hypothetical protein